jgi:hypothetical protein
MSENFFMNNQNTLTTKISENPDHDTNNHLSKNNENDNSKLMDVETKSSNSLKPPPLSKAYRRRSKTYSGEEFSAQLEHFNQVSSSNEEHNKRTDTTNIDLNGHKRDSDELKINKYTTNKELKNTGSVDYSSSTPEHFSNNSISNNRIANSSCKNTQYQSTNSNLNRSSKKCVLLFTSSTQADLFPSFLVILISDLKERLLKLMFFALFKSPTS